jgi:hypothetical protein
MAFGVLLADLPPSLEGIAREFNRGVSSTGLVRFALVVVLLLLVVSFLAYWYRTKERTWRFYSRRALWRELCRAHAVTANQRRALREVARAAGIEPAAGIFLNPGALDAARTRETDPERARELSAAYETLFGS